jgi:hypothetical protein
MPQGAFENLDKLNKYFGSNNLIQRIRTKFAFHSDSDSISLAYSKMPSDFTSVEYLSEYTGHKLFRTSETLSVAAMAGHTLEDVQGFLDSMISEITETCFVFELFLLGIFDIIYKKHLGLTSENLQVITIADDPSVDEMRLPFFCLPPRAWGRNGGAA